MKTVFYNPLLFLLLGLVSTSQAEPTMDLTGREIMDEIYSRHQQYPYVYEEQSMVMRDRNGKRDTRKAHRYSRVEKDGTAKFMLVFDFPHEIRGVAVLAIRDPSGNMKKLIYLPAFAEHLIESSGGNSDENFLGTDFTVENIIGEILNDYNYKRRQDRNINGMGYFIIDVYRPEDDVSSTTPLRRHFVRQDNYFINKTEHYDNHGRLQKRQSYHDLRAVDGDMWRSGMILMEDIKEQHQSLLKVTRRKFSYDYVPAEMFTADWLYKNHPHVEPESVLEDMDKEGDENMTVEDDEQLFRINGMERMQP